jgi:hypothetical protein
MAAYVESFLLFGRHIVQICTYTLDILVKISLPISKFVFENSNGCILRVDSWTSLKMEADAPAK